jgi:hypothetical protein
VAADLCVQQRNQLTKVPEPLLLDNAVCVAPINQLAMLHDYANPAEKLIADPNQDVVYGLGYLSLEKEPVVQAPDFGDRFWTLPVYDARTDQITQLGLQYGTKPGFYVIVGPNWNGGVPPGIAGVVRASTDFAASVERIAIAQRGRRLQFTDDVPLVERSAVVTGKPSTPALPAHPCAMRSTQMTGTARVSALTARSRRRAIRRSSAPMVNRSGCDLAI